MLLKACTLPFLPLSFHHVSPVHLPPLLLSQPSGVYEKCQRHILILIDESDWSHVDLGVDKTTSGAQLKLVLDMHVRLR